MTKGQLLAFWAIGTLIIMVISISVSVWLS